jgi:hypothetical protein
VKHRILSAWAVAAVAAVLAAAGTARADEPMPPFPQSAPAAPVVVAPLATPADLLAAADAAVDAGNLEEAGRLYEQLAREHPSSPEANAARRALKIIAARNRTAPPAAGDVPPRSDGGDGVVIRRETYSTRTSERLRLSTWEKVDFGSSAFLYGMSVGFSYALSSGDVDDKLLPAMTIGALAYTTGAVAYLQVGNPDRGDLPLVLAITSYVPTTTLLVSSALRDNPEGQDTALAVAGSAVLAIPAAVIAARKLDLDPGDTQLVRDAGFWGLVLATTGTLAFGGETTNNYGFEQYISPTDRKIAAFGLAGLYGGLALGTIGALNSEVSLERVRVTTWGGYGGSILGLMLGAGTDNGDRGVYAGMTIGGALGLLITFLATSSLDGIPPEDAATAARRPSRWAQSRWAPSLLPIAGVDGRTKTGLGISGALF